MLVATLAEQNMLDGNSVENKRIEHLIEVRSPIVMLRRHSCKNTSRAQHLPNTRKISTPPRIQGRT
jgi:hypothetical protein